MRLPRIDAELTNVGSYTGSASPNGTFDQGGNVWEWNESIINGSERGLRGGDVVAGPTFVAASNRDSFDPSFESVSIGFRVASLVPEPGTRLLLMVGSVCLALIKRRRRQEPRANSGPL